MIAVTGASGFIGSVLLKTLNEKGIEDIALIDDFEINKKLGYASRANYTYLQNKKFKEIIPINFDYSILFENNKIDFIFHLGAISNTLEKCSDRIYKYNTFYTELVARYAKENNIPVIFASSASVYGNGDGPLNDYARSKLEGEKALEGLACCFRIFNAYGPNEYHKEEMSSVILKWFRQNLKGGSIKLFERSDLYIRDFIYVQDICDAMYNCFKNYKTGVFDLGSGFSVSFDYLADCFLNKISSKKEIIKMPNDLSKQYQPYTKSDISGVTKNGWISNSISIENGIDLYLKYLINNEQVI
jgi:ADP-L-glycero-D-manno-heptose 6-epimerase